MQLQFKIGFEAIILIIMSSIYVLLTITMTKSRLWPKCGIRENVIFTVILHCSKNTPKFQWNSTNTGLYLITAPYNFGIAQPKPTLPNLIYITTSL